MIVKPDNISDKMCSQAWLAKFPIHFEAPKFALVGRNISRVNNTLLHETPGCLVVTKGLDYHLTNLSTLFLVPA